MAQLFHASKWDTADFETVCKSVRAAILDGGKLNEDELFDRLGLFGHGTPSAIDQAVNRLDIDDVRACFGALSFILANARMYQVSERQLEIELEQLGLASQHSRVLCKYI